jgi:hypothetical protein
MIFRFPLQMLSTKLSHFQDHLIHPLTLSGPAFFHVSHGPGWVHFSPPPWYLSPEASEGSLLNMTIDGYPLKNFLRVYNFFVAQNLTILETTMHFC